MYSLPVLLAERLGGGSPGVSRVGFCVRLRVRICSRTLSWHLVGVSNLGVPDPSYISPVSAYVFTLLSVSSVSLFQTSLSLLL